MSAACETAADAGVPTERTLILGFSQGACLAGEFVVRTPRRYGGLVVLSGSLLGIDTGSDTGREYEGSIDGTPVFLGCGADDPSVPAERVHESARVFEQLGGDVDSRLYDDLDHAINDDEIRMINALLERLV